MGIFEVLNDINVNEHTEKKGNLTYLSWAWAWAEVKKIFPDTTYKVYENADGWNYHTDGRTCWVKVSVTIQGLEHIEYLPVMDFKNKSIPLDKVTSFEVNTSIQRALTKACARHGLGLYIYAGEDLPNDKQEDVSALRISTTKASALIKLLENNADPLKAKNITAETICKKYKVTTFTELTESQYTDLMSCIRKVVD